MWRSREDVDVLNYSQNHIFAWVTAEAVTTHWLLIGFYGEHENTHRQRTQTLLRDIVHQQLCPWMVIGDFNKILFQFEKVGGKQRSDVLMSNFRQTMEDCGLYDLGYQDDFFTWSNKHD